MEMGVGSRALWRAAGSWRTRWEAIGKHRLQWSHRVPPGGTRTCTLEIAESSRGSRLASGSDTHDTSREGWECLPCTANRAEPKVGAPETREMLLRLLTSRGFQAHGVRSLAPRPSPGHWPSRLTTRQPPVGRQSPLGTGPSCLGPALWAWISLMTTPA